MTAFLRPHDEEKYMDSRSGQNDIQPSPLALLAATCSKIGESLEQDRHELTTNGIISKFSENLATTVCYSDTNEFPRVCLRNEEYDSGRHHENGKIREPCAFNNQSVLQQRPLLEELRLRTDLCQNNDGPGVSLCQTDPTVKSEYVSRKHLLSRPLQIRERRTSNCQVSSHEVAKGSYNTCDYQSSYLQPSSCKIYDTGTKRTLSGTEQNNKLLPEFSKAQLVSCLHGKTSHDNTGMNVDYAESNVTKPSCMWEQARETNPLNRCLTTTEIDRPRLHVQNSPQGDLTRSPTQLHAQNSPQFQYLSPSPPHLTHTHTSNNIAVTEASIHKQELQASNSQYHQGFMNSPSLPPVLSHQSIAESPANHYPVSQSQAMFDTRQAPSALRVPFNQFGPGAAYPDQASMNSHLQHAEVDRARYNAHYPTPTDYSETKWFPTANTVADQIRLNPPPNMSVPPPMNMPIPPHQVGMQGNPRAIMSVPPSNNVELALQMNSVDMCTNCVPNTPPCPESGAMVSMACDSNATVLTHGMPENTSMMDCSPQNSPVMMSMHDKMYHDNNFSPAGPAMNQLRTLEEQENYAMYVARGELGRRPRRIACTCPNCRDGENKTVTTKDGKSRKLHVCHIPGCGKIYGKTSHLRAHLRWHSGERPFICNWLFCNKRFTRSDELQRHRRTHTGEKRFQCNICSKRFMRSDHLSKHTKTHQAQDSSPIKSTKVDELADTLDSSSLETQFGTKSVTSCSENELVQASMVLVNQQDGRIKVEDGQ